MTHATETIKKLNDDFRTTLTGGQIMMTPGITALGPDAVARLIDKLIAYDDFSEDSDPHHEHDFGAIEIDGERTFFKVDYFSVDLQAHSPDPTNPKITRRVMTVMLASEY